MEGAGRRRRNEYGVCDFLRPAVRILGVATAIGRIKKLLLN